ncbi:hypothetical protein Hanom_Chr07g00669051 [Helianthus anomalus]
MYILSVECIYSYQLPAGMPNHTCGGANIWVDIVTSRDIFCSSGSYCPTSTQKIPCSSGYFTLVPSQTSLYCFKFLYLVSCDF